jgi:hypothetical protein
MSNLDIQSPLISAGIFGIDLTPLLDDSLPQIYVILALVAAILVIVAFCTEGMARVLTAIGAVICIAVFLALLGNLADIGKKFSELIYQEGTLPSPIKAQIIGTIRGVGSGI